MECESGNETVTLNYDRSAGFTNNSVAYFMTLPATIAIGEKFTVTVVTENAEGVATTYTKECTVEGKDIILPQGKSAQIGIDFTKPVEDVFTFTAATEKDTYAVGEAVNFTFGGNATAVEFWSGEWGKEYQYKDQKRMEIEALTLTFNASISGIIIRETGETRNCDRSLNISTDFTLNSEDPAGSITNATWTKLNANLSSSTDVAHSIDLTEYKTAPFSLGLQFKKTSTWTSTNKIRLYVKNVSLTAKLTNGRSIQIRGVSDFSTYNVSNNVFTNADTTNNYLYCMTDNSHTLNAESWLCTRRVIPCNNGIISITPDTGTVLTDLSSLTHTFTEAGTYTVTFVANSDIEGSEPIIITKTITVTK